MLNIRYTTNAYDDECDACRKPVGKTDPAIMLYAHGRGYESRNFIAVHIHCFNRLGRKDDPSYRIEVEPRARGASNRDAAAR